METLKHVPVQHSQPVWLTTPSTTQECTAKGCLQPCYVYVLSFNESSDKRHTVCGDVLKIHCQINKVSKRTKIIST